MIKFRQETKVDTPDIEALLDVAFGNHRYSRIAYKFRSGVRAIPELCLVAYKYNQLIGSIRFWPIDVSGSSEGLLLGPIAVYPTFSRLGIGTQLIQKSLALAKTGEYDIVVAFGSHKYLGRFGFCNQHNLKIETITDIDQERFLVLELKSGSRTTANGLVKKVNS